MANGTVGDLVAWMAESAILEPGQHEEVQRLVERGYSAPRALAKELMARGWLTPFQANYLVQGRIQNLLFGQYIIVDKLGEGGMGTVFKAKHPKLGRIVALKIIKKEYLSHPSAAKRFRREIQAAAKLNHPNIVLALDSDAHGDTHFYAMEYIEGIDLRHLLKKQGPLALAQTCDYMRQTALGLQHAFERGLAHRDIKPSNLFVTTKVKKGSNPGTTGPWGQIKILDLGLARAVADTDADFNNTLTCAGAVVGTPDYIAPEQARDSRTADTRSDIYSLGCSFYHLLTGQVPYPGGTGMEKLFKHQIEPAKPVREHRAEIPKDVEAVIHRMMAKKPEERYQTPAEVAKALEPLIKNLRKSGVHPLPDWVTQETVVAIDPAAATPPNTEKKKRSSKVEPARTPVEERAAKARFGSRRTLVAIAGGVGGLILVSGLLFAIFSGNNGSVAPTQTGTGTQVQPGPKDLSPLDRLSLDRVPAVERAELPPEAVALLGEHKLRHWGQVTGVAFSPDSTLLASAGSDRAVRIWELASGNQRAAIEDFAMAPHLVAFTGDGRSLVTVGYDLTVRIHDVGNGVLRSNVVIARVEGTAQALSPDGRTLLLAGGKSLKLWDLMQNRERVTLEAGTAAMAAFSANGQALVTWSRTGGAVSSDVVVWDALTGERRFRLPATAEAVLSAAVSNDGRMVAVSEGKHLVIVNAAAGQVLGRFETAGAGGAQLAFSPDGRSLVVSLTGRTRLLNLANLKQPVWERRAGSYSSRMTFSPDGSLIATGGFEPVVHLLEAATGQERFLSNRFSASQVMFAADAGSLVTGSMGSIHSWDLTNLSDQAIEVGGSYPQLAALSRDGRRIVARGSDGISVWDAATGTRLGQVAVSGSGAWAVFSSDAQTAAMYSYTDRSIQVWDLNTFRARPALQGRQVTQGYPTLSLSANGKALAIGEHGQVRLYDTLTGKPLTGFLGQKSNNRYAILAVSPDGSQVAASGDATIRLWNAASGQELLRLTDASAKFGQHMLLFSPDGQTLAAWSQQRMWLWDASTGKPRSGFSSTLSTIRTAAFSPDGKWLAAADQEGRVQVWDATSGLARQQIVLPGPAVGLAFAADGRHLATANANGTVYILRLGQQAARAATAVPRRVRPAMPEEFQAEPAMPPPGIPFEPKPKE